MKKVYGVLCGVFLVLLPFSIRAKDPFLEVSCPVEIEEGKELSCDVIYRGDVEDVHQIQVDYQFPEGLSGIQFENVSEGTVQADDTGFEIMFQTSPVVDEKIGKITVSLPEKGNPSSFRLRFQNVKYSVTSDIDTLKSADDFVSNVVVVLNHNNDLESLEISSGTLSPAFQSDILEYNASVAVDKIEITAIPMDENATLIDFQKEVALSYGQNDIKIVVESSLKDRKTYIIHVTRLSNKSSNNQLASMSITGVELGFQKNQYVYQIRVPYETTELAIKAVPEDSKATVEITGKQLQVGDNTVVVKVTAEDGSSLTYAIYVRREERVLSSVATLKELTAKEYNLNFNTHQYDYSLTVSNEVIHLDLTAVPTDSKAKVTITGNENFIVGQNVISILVVAEDNTEQRYTITVTKEAEKLSDDNSLAGLQIQGYSLPFQSDTLNYRLKIGAIDVLSITAIPSDEKATVEILGNEKLKDGSRIRIQVTSESGKVRTYQITIEKEEGKAVFFLIAVAIILVLAGVIIWLVIRKRKLEVKEVEDYYDEKNRKE